MIKVKGVEQPISMFKAWLPDSTLDQLEELKEYFKCSNNIIALIYIINSYYNFVNMAKDYLEKEEIKAISPSDTQSTEGNTANADDSRTDK